MDLSNLLNNLSENKPLLALIYTILSFIGAFIIDKIFISFLKIIVKRSKTDLDDKLIDTLHKPIYYSILFFIVYIFSYRIISKKLTVDLMS